MTAPARTVRLSCAINRQEATQSNLKLKKKNQANGIFFETIPVPSYCNNGGPHLIISQLINLIYNMADTIYIGMTGDPYKTAAVTLAFTLFMMTVSFSNLFGIGGGSLYARLMGSGQTAEAKKVSAFSFYGSIIIAVLYSLLIGLFSIPFLICWAPLRLPSVLPGSKSGWWSFWEISRLFCP